MRIFGVTEAYGPYGSRVFVHESHAPYVKEVLDVWSTWGGADCHWPEMRLLGWEFCRWSSMALVREALKERGFVEKTMNEVMNQDAIIQDAMNGRR